MDDIHALSYVIIFIPHVYFLPIYTLNLLNYELIEVARNGVRTPQHMVSGAWSRQRSSVYQIPEFSQVWSEPHDQAGNFVE